MADTLPCETSLDLDVYSRSHCLRLLELSIKRLEPHVQLEQAVFTSFTRRLRIRFLSRLFAAPQMTTAALVGIWRFVHKREFGANLVDTICVRDISVTPC